MMKRVLFTLLALCVLCMGLQAQNTNTSNQKGVTVTGQLDTVRNTRLNPTTQNEQIQSKFVDQFGKTGQRPGLSPYGQRLKAVIKITSSSMVSNSVSATTVTIAAAVSDSGDYALPIIERGVCYATTASPTLLTPTATKVTDATISGKGFGNFEVSLSGLQPHTAYHARAYAVSLYDTVYGEDLTFTTLFLAGSISYSTTVVEKMTTEIEAFTNPLTKVGDGTVTYSKSGDNYNICTVNANTGAVILTGNTGTCTITATVANSSSYTYATNTASYTLTVKTPQQTPLTFEAKTSGTITFKNKASGAVTYRINGGSEQTIASNTTGTINVIAGQKVAFYGNNTNYATSTSIYDCSEFGGTAECYVYGNIMSLINKVNFATNTTLTANYTFAHLFYRNEKIFCHSSKVLVLPATTLAAYCYYYMFCYCTEWTSTPALPATTLANWCYAGIFADCPGVTSVPELPATTLAEKCYYAMFGGCTGITSPPALPATTLAPGCYSGMFSGCTSLTSTPELPVETLTSQCYYRMFAGCTSLTSAPELPATTMASECYLSMFNGCTGLTSAPALPATTLANNCYSYMFMGCTGLTSAPKLPATTMALQCYYAMFRGCTGLTSAPVLPATTLAEQCYQIMFQNCTNLNSVTCLATNISATWCTKDWLDGVAASGTFYKATDANWSSGSDGIPSGWTTKNSMLSTPLTFEAMANGVTVSFTKKSDPKPTFQYKINNGAWTDFTFSGNTATTPTLNTGDKVSFKGTNTERITDGELTVGFSCSGNCYIYGNVMSLLDAGNYVTKTNLNNYREFDRLFYNNTKIHNHPSQELVLPATTLTEECYAEMFYGCTGLTSVPVKVLPATTLVRSCYKSMFNECSGINSVPSGLLPATTMVDYCYKNMFLKCTNLTSVPNLPATILDTSCYEMMFEGCASLTTAPTLPAETLSRSCYSSMFSGCTSLASAPALPATTLAQYCYSNMFEKCTSLVTAPALSATTLAQYCYSYMFEDCTSLVNAPALSATTLEQSCYSCMFKGCTSLTTAPVLPASELVERCYYGMFSGCSNLSKVTCLATTIFSANQTTYEWLKNVSATGTFTKASSANWGSNGYSAIPTDWTIVNQ